MTELNAAIATTRFGMGARPEEIAQATADPLRFLTNQIRLRRGNRLPDLPSSQDAWRALLSYRQDIRRIRTQGVPDPEAARNAARANMRSVSQAHLQARAAHAIMTEDSFAERWVRFWSNHFSVSMNGADMRALAPTLEAEAIRPNAFGRFETLTLAADLHPAMLVYLDNNISVSPNSPFGRRRGRGINENLAREILELHTLGAQGGYTQRDVEAFARALTGWTIGNPRLHDEDQWGLALFDRRLHQRGTQTVLGVRYAASDGDQARAIIADLANSDVTAHRLSHKLAQHFLIDNPSPDQVAHIERTWIDTGGDLAAIAASVVSAPGAFDPGFTKFKQPEEFMISAFRALELPAPRARRLGRVFTAIGQVPFTAPSPEGWPDDEASWADPDAIKKRLEFSNTLSRNAGRGMAPVRRAERVLGDRLDADTALSISRAESEVQGLTLLLMSPDFLRR